MFDARVFGVSHAEACVIDPQQRLVLRVVASLPKPTAAASVHVGVSQVEHPRMHLNARIETLAILRDIGTSFRRRRSSVVCFRPHRMCREH
jgi:hypothetical protein